MAVQKSIICLPDAAVAFPTLFIHVIFIFFVYSFIGSLPFAFSLFSGQVAIQWLNIYSAVVGVVSVIDLELRLSRVGRLCRLQLFYM